MATTLYPISASPMARQKQTGITAANSAFAVPQGAVVLGIAIRETAGNAVTGGLKFGTTAGGTDIAAAVAVAANSLQWVTDATLLKTIFGVATPQTIFIDAVGAWNNASVDIVIVYTSTF